MARKRKDGAGNGVGVYRDSKWRTCLAVEYGAQVKYVPLDISKHFEILETSKDSFDKRYKFLPSYPLDKAAHLYINYAIPVGGTEEFITYMKKFTEVSDSAVAAIAEKYAVIKAKEDKKKARKLKRQKRGY